MHKENFTSKHWAQKDIGVIGSKFIWICYIYAIECILTCCDKVVLQSIYLITWYVSVILSQCITYIYECISNVYVSCRAVICQKTVLTYYWKYLGQINAEAKIENILDVSIWLIVYHLWRCCIAVSVSAFSINLNQIFYLI